MGYPIKFLQLQKSELQYEVSIRGEEPANVVLELRRQVTKLTQLYPSEDIIDTVFDFATDLKGVNDTLLKVKANLSDLNNSVQSGLIERTRSLLNHLYFRLLRFATPSTTEQKDAFKCVSKLFDDFYAQFHSLTSKEGGANVVNATTTEDTATDKTISGVEKLNISVTCDRGLAGDISKLKFDGKSCVRAFIQRLEEFRISKGLTEEKIFSLSFELFSGDALHWFRAISTSVKSWVELTNKLKIDFDIIDYDYRMLSEIRSRTQGETENIIIYLSIMQGMFARLTTPLLEREKLEILLHNIRPIYTQILATCPNVNSIDQLRDLCKNYEQAMARAADFKEPPTSSMNTLAPEFSYSATAKPGRSGYRPNGPRYFSNQTVPERFYSAKPSHIKVCALEKSAQKVFCLRCRVDTHSMKECTAERDIFCFKCGLKDIKTPDCPNCNSQALPQPLGDQKN